MAKKKLPLHQVYLGDMPIDKPIRAVHGVAAIRIIEKRTGYRSSKYRAELIPEKSVTQVKPSIPRKETAASAKLAELSNLFCHLPPQRATCPNCGYFDPQRWQASHCPNCDESN